MVKRGGAETAPENPLASRPAEKNGPKGRRNNREDLFSFVGQKHNERCVFEAAHTHTDAHTCPVGGGRIIAATCALGDSIVIGVRASAPATTTTTTTAAAADNVSFH